MPKRDITQPTNHTINIPIGGVMTPPYEWCKHKRSFPCVKISMKRKIPRRRVGRRGMGGQRLMSKFMFMISLMARASSVMLASPWMVCLMTELATAKFTMSMGL